MRKLLILLLATTLITSCKNDKKTERRPDREKDDYRSRDEETKDTGKDADYKDDNTSRDKENNSENKGSWSSEDITSFNQQCLQTLNNNRELSDKFCPCLLSKMQKKYASLSEMDTKSTEEEGRQMGEQCKTELNLTSNNDDRKSSVSGWPQNERDDFITECVRSAVKNGQRKAVASSYCECMLEKIEALYPDINDAGRLSKSEIERVMMKYRNGCLYQ